MAKRSKTMLILVVVLVIAIIGIVAEKMIQKHVDSVNTVDEEVFTTSEDDLTSIILTQGSTSLIFNKSDDGTWTYEADGDFPVSQDKIAELIGYFQSVHASFVITDVEDYSQYGLKSPEATISFTTADGTSEVEFGTYSTMDSKRYISVDSGDVYLIDDDILSDMTFTADDYLDYDTVTDFDQLTELKVSGKSNFDLVYDADTQYTYTDSYDYYLIDGDDHKPVAESKITSYIDQIRNIDTSAYVTYKATSDDLAKYGLDNPDITVVLTGDVAGEDEDDTESQSQTIYFSSVDDKDYYAYFDQSTIVYSIDEAVFEALADGSYDTLRPDEIVSLDWTSVSSLTATIDGTSYLIDVSSDGDDGNTYTYEGSEVDFTSAASKIDSLSLTEAGSDYSKGKQELRLLLQLNDDNATSLDIILYQYDGDSCIATLDGETIGLVSRSSMSSLREDITSALLNKDKDEDSSEE